jgi:hypothetical protein
MIRIQYQLTPEDYAEAGRRQKLSPTMLIALCGAVAGLILLPQIFWPQIPLASPAAAAPGSLFQDLVVPLLSWGAVMLLIWVWVFGALRRATTKPWKRRVAVRAGYSKATLWLTLILVCVVVVVMMVLAIAAKRRGAIALRGAADPTFSPVLDTLIPIASLLLVFALLIFLVPRITSARRLWQKQEHLHRPFAAEIDEQSFRVSEPLSSHVYDWDYFQGFVETPNVFVLYPSPLILFMIPKRAFASLDDQRWLAELLRHRISERTGAFPVIRQPAAPLPLPPLHANPINSSEH